MAQPVLKIMQNLPNKEPTLRVPAVVQDTNPSGTIFGGWLMGQIDIAGSIPALVHSKGPVVTAAVKNMSFLAPLFAGDLLSIYAELTACGKSSMTVKVECWIQRNASNPQCLKVSDAELVFVAVDNTGKKRSLSPFNEISA